MPPATPGTPSAMLPNASCPSASASGHAQVSHAQVSIKGGWYKAFASSIFPKASPEGQITKLKLLKRSLYGLAKLDPLRQHLLLAA